jgi:hypothetical protein
MVVVNLSAALICFLGSCYPALVGVATPMGVFQLEQRSTVAHGYGGDVLLFKEEENGAFAIHRVINFNPDQRRWQRIASPAPRDRVITDGCINVAPDVYEKLVDCCSTETLVIK